MTSLAAPKVALQLVPVPKTVLYAGIAGELLKNTGMMDADQIGAVQQCMSEGMIARLIVRARHPDGRDETFTLAIKPFGLTDSVMLQPEAGKSFCETLDASIAAAVQQLATLIARLRLTPRFEVDWSDRAKANPHLVAAAARRLNIKGPQPPAPPAPLVAPAGFYEPSGSPPPAPPVRYPQTVRTYTAPPPPPAGYQRVTVLEITPAKDPGVTVTLETTRRV